MIIFWKVSRSFFFLSIRYSPFFTVVLYYLLFVWALKTNKRLTIRVDCRLCYYRRVQHKYGQRVRGVLKSVAIAHTHYYYNNTEARAMQRKSAVHLPFWFLVVVVLVGLLPAGVGNCSACGNKLAGELRSRRTYY